MIAFTVPGTLPTTRVERSPETGGYVWRCDFCEAQSRRPYERRTEAVIAARQHEHSNRHRHALARLR